MQPPLFIANYIIEYSNDKSYSINNLILKNIIF